MFPRRNLPSVSEPWGRKIDEVVRSQGRDIENLKLATLSDNRSNAGQLGVVGRQIEAISAQQAQIVDTQARLENAAQYYSNSTGATHTGATWMPSPPSVTASSLSGRFLITVSGGSSGGTTFFTFSTKGYSRDRALGATASAVQARVSVLGGAASPGSGQRSWVVTMPGTGEYTFTGQAYPLDQYSTAIGLQIDVQPLL